MRNDLPSGTVTFLFTDVEGSTSLLHRLGSEGYAEALAEHRRVIRKACARHDGVEVDTQGDAFFVAFPTAPSALAAAEEMTSELASGPIRVRIGLHTGAPLLTDEGYVGGDVHRAARIAAAGHGGQVLVSASTAQLVEIELTDLGEHRFKDLGAPERVYQLGAGEFPALKSLYRTNLPVPSTPFVGRERELADVLSLLEGARLLTLTGPGGTGKTRLAIQAVAAASDAYPDGVYWVPLAPLRDPALVLEEASQALGAKNGLAEHIADKRLLLLFDNFEQVVEAASELPELLASCPNLDVLVTSRELLQLPAEQAYPVPPLADDDGAEFFTTRARAVLPTFTSGSAVPELCAKLDQLPLALELAAARMRVMSPEQLLERLSGRLDLLSAGRGADHRQQTLRATIEWSYELLSEDEQRLFARLACFRGGCTLEAAEEICEADVDSLQALVDKSLLRYSNERYWMLETIGEYGVERLNESGEAEELRLRHAVHFLALADEAFPKLLGTPGDWLDRLEAEHDNLRAALDHLETSGDTQSALQLAGALYRFWWMRGHLAEGARRIELLLVADSRPTAARGRALHGVALVATDAATIRSRAQEALDLHSELGDAWGVAFSVAMLAGAEAEEGDYEAALALWEEAASSFRELGDEHYSLMILNAIAHAHGELGDLERERALHEEALRLARVQGNERMAARTLYSVSWHELLEGRPQESIAMVNEALATYLRLGEAYEVAMGLRRFAWALAVEGQVRPAAQLFAKAEALREEIGASLEAWIDRMDASTLDTIHSQLDEGTFDKTWEAGRRLTIEEAVALAVGS